MSHTLNALVASEVVKASVGDAVSATGVRGAIMVVEQSSGEMIIIIDLFLH